MFGGYVPSQDAEPEQPMCIRCEHRVGLADGLCFPCRKELPREVEHGVTGLQAYLRKVDALDEWERAHRAGAEG